MMLMPASAEFAALCQSQLAMVTELVGAESTAVYIAESWTEQQVPNLLLIAVYPSDERGGVNQAMERTLPATSSTAAALQGPVEPTGARVSNPDSFLSTSSSPETAADSTSPLQRLAIPMVHEGGVFGVLVGWLADRSWLDADRDRMETCAQSLTLACVLDQRGQWLKTQMSSLDRVQTQQSDRFHELLHQLRSPLTALKTFGKLLTKRLPAEDPNQTLVANMLRESDRMQELLGYFDDTLQAADDSREETAKTLPLLLPAHDASPESPPSLTAGTDSLAHFGGTLSSQAIAISSIVLPLVELTQPLAEDTEKQLHAIPPSEESWVQADPKALTEILSILLDNALKYATPGSQIWFEWGWSPPQLPDLVATLLGDTGPGIPPADQARIFERHYRGLQASGDLEGSGLGLAIAADLIQTMRGSIQVFSPLSELPHPLPEFVGPTERNRGTAFVLWLPRARSAPVEHHL